MAFVPSCKRTIPKYTGAYTPKYMNNVSVKDKVHKSPVQPTGLVINSSKLANYTKILINSNDINGYKYLFEQIKILIKSVMNVLCDKEYYIDTKLFEKINGLPHSDDVVILEEIKFPLSKYDANLWLVILYSLLPNAKYTYSKEWFDILLYVYQNIMLTINAKKREEIDTKYNIKICKATSRQERCKYNAKRKEKLSELRENVYEWINYIGDTYGKTREHEFINKLLWSIITLRFENQSVYINLSRKYDKQDYFNELTIYRNNDGNLESYMIAELIELTYCFHYDPHDSTNYALLSKYIMSYRQIVERYCKGCYLINYPISMLFNQLVPDDVKLSDIISIINTYPKNDTVKKQIVSRINAIPQLSYTVKAIGMSDIPKDCIIQEQINNRDKQDDNYQLSIAYAYLYDIYDDNDLWNEELLPNSIKISTIAYIIDNGINLNIHKLTKSITLLQEMCNGLIDSAKLYTKYRYNDAIEKYYKINTNE